MHHPDWLRLVNCAECGRELAGETMQSRYYQGMPPLVAGRILGRPYCATCLGSHPAPPSLLRNQEGDEE